MTVAIVITLLVVLPVLKVTRCLSADWLATLSPAWASFLVLAWTGILSGVELTTSLGFLVWLPGVAGMFAFVVAWIDAPDPAELDPTDPPAYGAGGLGDRVLELVEEVRP